VDDSVTPRGSARRLVFFDLDGTITRRDTLSGYVTGFALGHPLRWLGFLRVLPALAGFMFHRDRGRLKGALIRAVMGGTTRSVVDDWTRRYVPQLLARGVFADALACIRRHRDAGDHLVLMSATVDLYVPAIAAELGFDEYLCSRVAWEGERLQGQLISRNVRDQEKARLLREAADRRPGLPVVAYGNSSPDLPHLLLADEAVLVNPGSRLRRAEEGTNIRFLTWI